MVWLGFVLIWGGYTTGLYGYSLIRGYDITLGQMVSPTKWYSQKWPPPPAGNIQIIPTGVGTQGAATTTAFQVANSAGGAVNTPGGAGAPGNTGAANATAKQNQALAQSILRDRGLGNWASGPQWLALVKLWNQESGWNAQALNAGSGATGIPQLLPGQHNVPANWSSPSVQINWGISYIRQRYGSPVAAWAHEVAYGWY